MRRYYRTPIGQPYRVTGETVEAWECKHGEWFTSCWRAQDIAADPGFFRRASWLRTWLVIRFGAWRKGS